MNTKSGNLLISSALQPITDVLKHHGYDNYIFPTSLIKDFPIFNSNQKISVTQYDRILEHVGTLINEPAIGLEAGKRFTITNLKLLSFLIQYCSTGRELLSLLRRYFSVISNTRTPEFFIGQDEVKVIYHLPFGTMYGNQTRAELVASSVLTASQSLVGKIFTLKEIGFRHPTPAYNEKLQRLFQCPIYFQQPNNWICFASKFIQTELPSTSPKLFATIKAMADEALDKLSELNSFSRIVVFIMNEWPETQPFTKDAVADLLGTSSRTLTRRLQAEGISFSTLAKNVRLKKAQQALIEEGSDVQQLALELGFSDRRGFERAFKQWTGVTPAAYRRRHTVTR